MLPHHARFGGPKRAKDQGRLLKVEASRLSIQGEHPWKYLLGHFKNKNQNAKVLVPRIATARNQGCYTVVCHRVSVSSHENLQSALERLPKHLQQENLDLIFGTLDGLLAWHIPTSIMMDMDRLNYFTEDRYTFRKLWKLQPVKFCQSYVCLWAAASPKAVYSNVSGSPGSK